MDDASLCAGGCGFYGSATTKDLCSKCYKLYLQKLGEETTKNHAIPRTSSDGAVWDDLKVERFRLPRIKVTGDQLWSDSKNRCSWCDKKVGLLGFRCRCGGSFCGKHRYPEVNGVEGQLCFYDYKTLGRAALEKENPVVIADKLANRI